MNRRPLEGLILYGMKEVYELFRQSYVSKGKYRLPIWIGYNKSSKKEVTVIPLEQRDEQIKTDLISLFHNEERFRFIESRAKDGITFVVLDVLPSEFENIYLNLPVASASQNIPKTNLDTSQVTISGQKDKKDKNQKQKKQNRFIPKAVWVGAFLLFFACGVSVYLTPRLFTQYPQPTNISEIIPISSVASPSMITVTDTLISSPTNTIILSATATNTVIQITTPSTLTPTSVVTSTLEPNITQTATIVPTRTGPPGTVYLCPAESGRNVRAVPSTQNNSPLGSLQKKDCLYYEEQFTDNNGMFWVKIALNETKFPGGWVAAGNPSSKPPTIYLIGNDFSSLPTPAIPPITSTPTSTPKITPTP